MTHSPILQHICNKPIKVLCRFWMYQLLFPGSIMRKYLVMKFHRLIQGILLSGKTGSPYKLPVWSSGWNTFSYASGPVLSGSKAIVKRSIQQHSAWAPLYHPSFQWSQLFQLCVVNCHRIVSLCYAVEDVVHRFLCLHHFSHLPRTTLSVSIPCINTAAIAVVYQHIFCTVALRHYIW